MQDYLEEYFGHQRQRGQRSDNPDAVQFGYNDRILQIQRNAGLVSQGNVGSRRKVGESRWATIREEPLPKRNQRTNQQTNQNSYSIDYTIYGYRQDYCKHITG